MVLRFSLLQLAEEKSEHFPRVLRSSDHGVLVALISFIIDVFRGHRVSSNHKQLPEEPKYFPCALVGWSAGGAAREDNN
jgi:hypothetical protein